MSNMQGLILFQKHYDLMLYAIPIINRFPASQRYVLRKSNLRRTRRKFRKYARLYREGLVDLDAIRPRIASWLGHAKHADTWHIRRQVLGETVFSRPSPETGR